jgi:hypothetical protein
VRQIIRFPSLWREKAGKQRNNNIVALLVQTKHNEIIKVFERRTAKPCGCIISKTNKQKTERFSQVVGAEPCECFMLRDAEEQGASKAMVQNFVVFTCSSPSAL